MPSTPPSPERTQSLQAEVSNASSVPDKTEQSQDDGGSNSEVVAASSLGSCLPSANQYQQDIWRKRPSGDVEVEFVAAAAKGPVLAPWPKKGTAKRLRKRMREEQWRVRAMLNSCPFRWFRL